MAETGTPSTMPAAEAKRVRFCNIAALAGLVCSLLFWLIELPVIASPWGMTTA